ncbi:MAG TPA: hypothetical protein VF162_08935 [Streptosporangiaceae bacterium]
MPTREQVRELAGEDLDHAGASRRLAGSQRLANPSHHNPAARESVKSWMAARVAADEQMRAACCSGARLPIRTCRSSAVSCSAPKTARLPDRTRTRRQPGTEGTTWTSAT